LVFREQCSFCHTLGGVNSLPGLTKGWDSEMKRQNFAKLQKLKPFMPPFAGTPTELESLVQFVEWVEQGRPDHWSETANSQDHAERLIRIRRWLNEAGTQPALIRTPPVTKGGR
jgi:mono/diheme cytochrome c family protein